MLNDLVDVESAHILIIDDNLMILGLQAEILHMHGFKNLTTLHRPQEAVEFYRTHRPDLVLLDYQMPGLNGIEVMRLFKQIGHYPPPPVIALTANNCQQTRLAFLSLGALDFLIKPIDNEELIYRVKNLLFMHLMNKESLQHNNTLDALVENRTNELLNTQKEILDRLGIAAEFKDKNTYSHTQRVGCFAACLAKTIGFQEQVVEDLLLTAPLHDIGKIGVPDTILLKPGKLDDYELELMKQHTTHGYNILKGSNSSLLKSAEIIALTHHERWDGEGYPQRLKNTEIHLYGRITAIADVYDALTMVRPYKQAWSHEQAATLISEGSGTQFDPELVDVFQTVKVDFISIAERFI